MGCGISEIALPVQLCTEFYIYVSIHGNKTFPGGYISESVGMYLSHAKGLIFSSFFFHNNELLEKMLSFKENFNLT